MPTLKAIIRELNDDTAICAKLSTFDFGSGEAPAIFATERPIEARIHSIVVNMIGGSNWGSEGFVGAKVDHDVRVDDDRMRSDKTVRETAWLIYFLFNHKRIAVDGYGNVPCIATPPQKLTTEDGFPGYLVRVQLWILKENT